jgi:hypothetical protein
MSATYAAAAAAAPAGTEMPRPLADKRPLPDSLPAGLLTVEGPSIYWHWKNLNNFQVGKQAAWLSCTAQTLRKELHGMECAAYALACA